MEQLYGDDPLNWKADDPNPCGINGFAPVITDPPTASCLLGTPVTLTTMAFRSEPLTFQWRFKTILKSPVRPVQPDHCQFWAAKCRQVHGHRRKLRRHNREPGGPVEWRLREAHPITITNPPNNARVTTE